MQSLPLFFQGLLLGFSIAAPVGPIGLICIQRTLERGRCTGFVSGLGAATADAVYGSVAAFGLTALTGALLNFQFWLQLGGGLFLLGFGVRIMRATPATNPKPQATAQAGLLSAYLSVFVLTLTNPATILSFLGMFAGFGMAGKSAGTGSALSLVAGVFLGSAAWWLLLSQLTGFFRRSLDVRGLRWVNLLAGISLIAMGLCSLYPLIRDRF